MKNQHHFTTHNFKLLGLFVVLLFLASIMGCDVLGFPQATPDAPTLLPAGEQVIPEALITFYVETPADTPKDEPVLLSVLDEVTGLGLNAKRYPMEKIDETHFKLSLPVKLGSTIKYRYSRSAEILAEEHITDGRPVRYRLFHAQNPSEVHDIVARWNDTVFNGPAGGSLAQSRMKKILQLRVHW